MNNHKLLILSKQEALDVNEKYPNQFFYLSIASENDGGWPDLYPDYKVCRLNFTDIAYPEVLKEEDILAQNIVLPSHSEIKKGIEFCRSHVNEPTIIHCYAGISRSAAMCFLVLFDRLRDVDLAKRALYEVKDRNLILPNPFILKLGFEVLTGSIKEAEILLKKYNSWA